MRWLVLLFLVGCSGVNSETKITDKLNERGRWWINKESAHASFKLEIVEICIDNGYEDGDIHIAHLEEVQSIQHGESVTLYRVIGYGKCK